MQDKVFAFLCDPAHHGDVQRIDTHAASVFLQGDRALKIMGATTVMGIIMAGVGLGVVMLGAWLMPMAR